MRIGTVCFATERGLGHLAKSFYDNGVVTDAVVLEHGSIPRRTDWYPDSPVINVRPKNSEAVKQMISDVDWMLFFETPFDWELINQCREAGVKTALMTMYECTPAVLPYTPDLFLCPSLLDQQYFPDNSVVIPVPVEIPWKLRTQAKTFVHNAGYVGLRGRNGTYELLQAMQYVKSPIELTVRAQTNELMRIVDRVPTIKKELRINIEVGVLPFNRVWSQHDVAIQPEKFNGLSLPLQEARASGMFVITTDRNPANTYILKDGLIPVDQYRKARIGGRFIEFDECILNPRNIAETIDEVYGGNVADYSLSGREWATTMTWEAIKPRYMEVFETWTV